MISGQRQANRLRSRHQKNFDEPLDFGSGSRAHHPPVSGAPRSWAHSPCCKLPYQRRSSRARSPGPIPPRPTRHRPPAPQPRHRSGPCGRPIARSSPCSAPTRCSPPASWCASPGCPNAPCSSASASSTGPGSSTGCARPVRSVTPQPPIQRRGLHPPRRPRRPALPRGVPAALRRHLQHARVRIRATRADDGIRTRDPHLGNVVGTPP